MLDLFTKVPSPIVLILALGVSLFVNRSLYSSLDKERAEKAKALATISTLEQRVITMSEMRKTDNQAAKDIFEHMELYNEVNANTALDIASLPSMAGGTQKASKTSNNKPNAARNTSKKSRNNEEPRYCNHKDQASTCNIDVPLPSLSAPLLLLYKNISNTDRGPSSLADGNKTSARSASSGDERPTVGAVGKGTSRNSRSI